MILMLIAFYFLLMRPQQKKENRRRELVNSAKRDDKVVTNSGIIGRIHKIISDKEVSLEVSDGIRIRILKNAISEILEKNSDLGKEDTETAPALKKNSKESASKAIKLGVKKITSQE
jgi:preprotein translocase subunit YajC